MEEMKKNVVTFDKNELAIHLRPAMKYLNQCGFMGKVVIEKIDGEFWGVEVKGIGRKTYPKYSEDSIAKSTSKNELAQMTQQILELIFNEKHHEASALQKKAIEQFGEDEAFKSFIEESVAALGSDVWIEKVLKKNCPGCQA